MTPGQNSADSFHEDLDDLIKDAMMLLEGRLQDSENAGNDLRKGKDNGELIESADCVNFILHAPGYSAGELTAKIVRQELQVEGPDFRVSRSLRASVRASTLSSTYVNGVFHARVQRAP